MLWLAMIHGCNGLRTIINDYASKEGTRLTLKGPALLRNRPRHRIGHSGDLHLRSEHQLKGRSNDMQVHRYDVVIVGAGGAGMRAALESGTRARTAVLTKLYPTRFAHRRCPGGMCAALANVEEDNWEWHTFDTIKGGDYLVDQDAAEVMCKEAIDAVIDLENMGLPFNRTPKARSISVASVGTLETTVKLQFAALVTPPTASGHDPADAVSELHQARHRVLQRVLRPDLILTARGRTEGRWCCRIRTGDRRNPRFTAKSVIFASGGFGKVFKTTSNALIRSPATAWHVYRKGLPLEDMEFWFHPTGLASPRCAAHGRRPRRRRHPAQR